MSIINILGLGFIPDDLPSAFALGFGLIVMFFVLGTLYDRHRRAKLVAATQAYVDSFGGRLDVRAPTGGNFRKAVDQMLWRHPSLEYTIAKRAGVWDVYVSRMSYDKRAAQAGNYALCAIAVLRDGTLPDCCLKDEDAEFLPKMARRLEGEGHVMGGLAAALLNVRYLRGSRLFWDNQNVFLFRYPPYRFREQTVSTIFEAFEGFSL